MSRKLNNTTVRQLVLLGALVMGMTLVAGCYLDLEPFGPGDPYWEDRIDLKVQWSYQGSDSPSWCDNLNVDRWVVELRGPESRDVAVSCHKDFWSSENDLLSLEPGHYTVRIKALDGASHMVASRSMALELHDASYLESVTVNFNAEDFH